MPLRSPLFEYSLTDTLSAPLPSTSSVSRVVNKQPRHAYLEFFAGSGLVAQGLKTMFKPIWANDIDVKKAAVYTANHTSKHFHLGSISEVTGKELPAAALAWASFPCQDLSLAGLAGGIHGKRSGLVWEWLRIIDEMSIAPRSWSRKMSWAWCHRPVVLTTASCMLR